jgi:ribosomal-protein-alanine N-acetyltransferase
MNLPPYSIFPSLSNGRITLRAVTPADMESLMEISFYDAKPAQSIEEAAQMQNRIDQDYAAGNSFHWCIEDLATKNVVGTCGYYRGFENGEGELGCVLRPAFYGKGYMTEAMKLAMDFGFNIIGLQKIVAMTSVHNDKAIQLLRRLQFLQTESLMEDELKFELRILTT